ncbi:hypothetical protein ACFR9U_17165 [Halorientalis brevis]|uniref:Uncharacterized protein n=1 Tax=Halorientalis brevis TaxID=1126241 RepID=A0ABD6CFA0_9EURY|nr:hypothetical protein [Halorientalis brevis]
MSNSTRLPVVLRGEMADRFLEIKEEIEAETGHEVNRTRVVSEMMRDWGGRSHHR